MRAPSCAGHETLHLSRSVIASLSRLLLCVGEPGGPDGESAETLCTILRLDAERELRIGQWRVDLEARLQQLALVQRRDLIAVERRSIEEQILVVRGLRGGHVLGGVGTADDEP